MIMSNFRLVVLCFCETRDWHEGRGGVALLAEASRPGSAECSFQLFDRERKV